MKFSLNTLLRPHEPKYQHVIFHKGKFNSHPTRRVDFMVLNFTRGKKKKSTLKKKKKKPADASLK